MLLADYLTLISYGVSAIGYAVLSLQLGMRVWPSPRGRLLLAACIAGVCWALAGMAVGVWPERAVWRYYQAIDALAWGAWIAFPLSLLLAGKNYRPALKWTCAALIPLAALTLAAAPMFDGADPLSSVSLRLSGSGRTFGLWVVACIAGLVLCEQLFRGTPPDRRWAIKPLCIGIGAMFAYDLFVFSDALLMRDLDQAFWSARGVVHAMSIPLVMMASVRNRDWLIDIGVSRAMVFRSTALLLSGLYLLALAGVGYLVRLFGGDWGKAIQSAFVFAGLVLLAVLIGSGSVRSRIRVFIGKNFFSYRYDYREEWLRFTSELATASPDGSVFGGSIRALANLVESPAGALWLKDEDAVFRLAACWNMPRSPADVPADASLPAFLQRTNWVVDLTELSSQPDRYAELQLPEWTARFPMAWLIVPLPSHDTLIGFVVLARPRAPLQVNWEVRDLLKTASRQAASFLGHVRVTEALVEAQQFDAFNRMSAFVVHDLKNLVAQLSLMSRNAERHAANPEFQRDMLSTIQHVVDRMNHLLLQLRSGTTPVENAKPIDLAPIVQRVTTEQASRGNSIGLNVQPGLRALGHEERLERVLGHLVQNAVDATPAGGRISVNVYEETGNAVIEVADTGHGMTPEFVREHLFRPFQSTKPSGMGIGAYESHRYVTELGGRILVDSAPGEGTRIRVVLPESGAGIAAISRKEAA
ncbi:MAG: PEP-CTERM system histidine kinase PrsK [Proteobacteria bacterium]|nr:MAG: PEP-CTERM system histidine kinase PrsK [Pseudomonadota bacterium]